MEPKEIMDLLNANGGDGVQIGPLWVPRDGMPVMAFVKNFPAIYDAAAAKHNERVKREREASEKAEAARPAADREVRNREPEQSTESRSASVRDAADVQGGEVSLEATLEAQVTALRRSVKEWQGQVAEATSRKRHAEQRCAEYERQLKKAERYLDDFRADNHNDTDVSPEVYSETSAGLFGEASEGESAGGDTVGEPVRTAEPSEVSKGGSGEDS